MSNSSPVSYEFMWQQYSFLEDELQSFLLLIPPDASNQSVWSPRLGHLLVSVCNILNSLFKSAQSHPDFTQDPDLGDACVKSKPEYGDFYLLFETIYRLSGKTVFFLLIPSWTTTRSDLELPDYKRFSPFDGWTAELPPTWWTLHNKLKHDWLNNVRQATLREVLAGFAGAFLVFVQYRESRKALIDARVIRLGGSPPSTMKGRYSGLEPFPTIQDVPAARTKLFGYMFENTLTGQGFPGRVFGPDSHHFD